MKNRKFVIALIAASVLTLSTAGGLVLAAFGKSVPWIGGVLSILASTFPAYMGANALSKKKGPATDA